MRDEKKALREY
jgi:hypothetical protein